MSELDYYKLTPDAVLDAIESIGIELDGTMLTLNSYENRVYRVCDIDGKKLVAKFYRPNRWSEQQIFEEHEFSEQLSSAEIPLVAPLKLIDGKTLMHWQSFRFSLFPCHGGRAPELDDENHLLWLGRFMARIHNVGAIKPFQYRPELNCQTFGHDCLEFLLQGPHIPSSLRLAYETIAIQVLEASQIIFDQTTSIQKIRLHGDCHPGNILWTDEGPHIVDLDDSRSGPAIQDLWMLLGGDSETMNERLDILLEGYEEFREFNSMELRLIEPLRSLRMIHYSAWLSRRWVDPSFQHHFPWFSEPRYWEEQILGLKEQLSALHDPPVRISVGGNC
ncbi:MAG: serine/threonine protein kinase [Gammaproteobacteria bacterium]|nr:MAG: serine/threonine protein kinase [Gammaproteobacteria bacterium]